MTARQGLIYGALMIIFIVGHQSRTINIFLLKKKKKERNYRKSSLKSSGRDGDIQPKRKALGLE
jgi:hypothetical protein